MKNLRFLFFGMAAIAIFGSGCVTYKDQIKSVSAARPSQATNGITSEAAALGKQAAKKDKTKDSVVWHLEAGAAYRAAGDYTNSNMHLQAAADKMDDYEQQAKVKAAHEAAAIMSNQQNLSYEGKSYDKIMAHTYLALNYLTLGEIDKARPEIIRAYQCQQDAVDDNARRIEKAKDEADKDKNKQVIQKSQTNTNFVATTSGLTKDLDGFKFYADYVNPFTVYLDGIYYLYAGSGDSDLEHAKKSLERVAGVCSDNKFIQADLETVTNALAGTPSSPCTYIIFETGKAASLDQVRIDIPIIVAKVSYVGAAFPKLAFHNDFAQTLAVKAGDLQETTEPLASMDSIIALDYKNELPVIITKTLISTVAKATAGYAINEAASGNNNQSEGSEIASLFVRLGTAIYQAAVNIADTRSWTELPKEFEIARIPTPADRKLTLSAGADAPVDVNLVDGTINVVYVKSVTANSPLSVSQFKLK